jgi:Phage portal protein, SPP1 Gp6-like
MSYVTLSTTPGSPVVAGITPFVERRAVVPSGGASDWPPDIDTDRLAAYADYIALVENRATDVFTDLGLAPDEETKLAIAVALPELLCNVWADAVWGDEDERGVSVELPTNRAQDKWDLVAEAVDLEMIGWESVFGTAARGTSVLQIGRDESALDRTGSEITVTEISPSIFFPRLRYGSAREIESVVIAWSATNPDDNNVYQYRELHRVERAQYVISYQYRKVGDTPWRELKPDVAPIGVDFLPFIDMHAKRWGGRYWGLSEIGRNMALFDEIDNTLSNIAQILEYHGAPVLQVPAAVVTAGTLYKGASKAIGIRNPAEAEIARYITYDGQLATQMASLDKNIELALLVSEVPRSYFADPNGGSPSGTAMRLRLQNYLKKVGRYRRIETRRIRALADMVLRLDDAGSGSGPRIADLKDRKPAVTYASPLPADELQDAQIEEGLVGAGLSSRETSITRLRRVDDVPAEIAKIDADQEKAQSTNFPPAQPNAANVDPGTGLPLP